MGLKLLFSNGAHSPIAQDSTLRERQRKRNPGTIWGVGSVGLASWMSVTKVTTRLRFTSLADDKRLAVLFGKSLSNLLDFNSLFFFFFYLKATKDLKQEKQLKRNFHGFMTSRSVIFIASSDLHISILIFS